VSGQPSSGVAGSQREDLRQPPYLYPDYVATRLRAPKKPLVILPRTLSDTTGQTQRRDGPRCLGRRSGGCGEGDDATGARLFVVAPRPTTESKRRARVGLLAQRLVHPLGGVPAIEGIQCE
jgi:hypothetical protein